MEDESSSKSKLFSLQDIQPSLLKRDYLDQSVMEAELKALWYTHWIYVCRENKIPKPGDYSIVDIGNQRIIVTRNNEGELRAFHNTCRHRGSEL
ncbi:MAG: Rieske 2Fe-2S domain-containing protein, partial [Pseudomonadota bacterium]|nr:Rieske 2Fe-2S domain-containing protein [Pseudomonadota bacterium]